MGSEMREEEALELRTLERLSRGERPENRPERSGRPAWQLIDDMVHRFEPREEPIERAGLVILGDASDEAMHALSYVDRERLLRTLPGVLTAAGTMPVVTFRAYLDHPVAEIRAALEGKNTTYFDFLLGRLPHAHVNQEARRRDVSHLYVLGAHYPGNIGKLAEDAKTNGRWIVTASDLLAYPVDARIPDRRNAERLLSVNGTVYDSHTRLISRLASTVSSSPDTAQ